MASNFEFNAESRSDAGTGAARALRRAGRVPGVLYGVHQDPEMISLEHREITKNLEAESVYSHVLTLNVDGKAQNVILKDLQRHPSKSVILHVDFQRVSEKEKLRIHVPIHFIGESTSIGVKKGGVVTHNVVELGVSCLPGDIPEFIEVDLTEVDLGGSVHLSDVTAPSGVEIYSHAHGGEQSMVIASIQSAKIAEEVETAEEVDGLGDSDSDSDSDSE